MIFDLVALGLGGHILNQATFEAFGLRGHGVNQAMFAFTQTMLTCLSATASCTQFASWMNLCDQIAQAQKLYLHSSNPPLTGSFSSRQLMCIDTMPC